MVWINVDKPLKSCTLHSANSCTYVMKKSETNFKGINRIKRDGGWISFPNQSAALIFFEDLYPNYEWREHC